LLLPATTAGAGGLSADDREVAADGDDRVLLDEDLREDTGSRRGDLGVDLVGGDLEEWFVDLDGVALGLQPPGDGALGDGLAQRRHRHRGAATTATARTRCAVPGAVRTLLLLLPAGALLLSALALGLARLRLRSLCRDRLLGRGGLGLWLLRLRCRGVL
jgi:hypothetical protein